MLSNSYGRTSAFYVGSVATYYLLVYDGCCRFVSGPVTVKSDVTEHGGIIKREVTTPLTSISSSASPFHPESFSHQVPFHSDSPYQSGSPVSYQSGPSGCCDLSVKSRSNSRNTDRENFESHDPRIFSDTLFLGKDLHVCPRLPLTSLPVGVLPPAQNCSLVGSRCSPYDKPSLPPPLPPPPLPFNFFCLPLHPSMFPPLLSFPPPAEPAGGMLSMQSLLARSALSAARLPPLLGPGLFPSNLAAHLPQAANPPRSELCVQRASEDGARAQGRRKSCDSTAVATPGGAEATLTTSSDDNNSKTTSSPRVVSSTSDDFDPYDDPDERAPAQLSDATGSSLVLSLYTARLLGV